MTCIYTNQVQKVGLLCEPFSVSPSTDMELLLKRCRKVIRIIDWPVPNVMFNNFIFYFGNPVWLILSIATCSIHHIVGPFFKIFSLQCAKKFTKYQGKLFVAWWSRFLFYSDTHFVTNHAPPFSQILLQ